jgi:branched-chain amino acid transport system ATP-binding protein
MLELSNIRKSFGDVRVLNGVNLRLEKGFVYTLKGGNGSGKSTVLKTIYGLLKTWTPEGKVIFAGEDITALPTALMLRKGIAYLPQKKNVFEDFTVEENLLTSASIYTAAEAGTRIQNVYEMLPALERLRKRAPFHLSGGEKQMLAFGNMLIHKPKLMLLDEPFAGVDVSNAEILKSCIMNLHRQNVTFIIVEHKRQLMDDMVTKVIELELGMIKVAA